MHKCESNHGNPVLLLPQSKMPTRRAVVLDCDTAQPVWRSHPLSGDRDSIRVDVWDGNFVGRFEAGCLMSRGLYEAMFYDDAGGVNGRSVLDINERLIFTGDLSKPVDSWFDTAVQWQKDGQWKVTSSGAVAENKRAFVFVDGAMHGKMQAEFVCPEIPQAGKTWGLITRHYNAFAHLRLLFTHADGQLNVHLVQVYYQPPNKEDFIVLAEASLEFPADGRSVDVSWSMNGSRHDVMLDGKTILNAKLDFMGGVTVVGLFTDAESACWRRIAMTTTQDQPTVTISSRDYEAAIRPGNIHQLKLRGSDAPSQNLFWESGIQFGHIGGSELKFTQSARLDMLCEGPAVSLVRWQGPMPKFVDRSDDVRGWAHGMASFYPDRIVLADYVTPLVRRSVGPDFDLLASIMCGPAKIATANQTEFNDWSLPADGQTVRLSENTCKNAYPLVAAFPYRLGEETWWLIAVISNLLNVTADAPANMFAWRDPHGLTASHDFRVSPCNPGTEYGFSIMTTWCKADDFSNVADYALRLRNEWINPMQITATKGEIISYSSGCENPAEAIGFDGCFDRAVGAYVVKAHNGEVELALDPLNIPRESTVVLIRDLPEETSLICELDDSELKAYKDYIEQSIDSKTRMIILYGLIDKPVVLHVKANKAAVEITAPSMPSSDGSVLNVDFENYVDDVFAILCAGVRCAKDPFSEVKQKKVDILCEPDKAYRGRRCGHISGDEPDQVGRIMLQRRYDAPRIAGDEVTEFMFRCVSDPPVMLEDFIVWSPRHIQEDVVTGIVIYANGQPENGVYRLDIEDAGGRHNATAVNLKQDEWLHFVLLRDRVRGLVHVWAGPAGSETWLGAYADFNPELPTELAFLGEFDRQSIGSGYWDDVRVGGVLSSDAAVALPETFHDAGEEKPTIAYPIAVGKEKQLFVDDVMIESLTGIKRTQYSIDKYADNPIMIPDKPWETQAGCILPMSVFRDAQSGLLRCWYSSWGTHKGKPTLECYAESQDGLNWDKPSLGIFTFDGSTENNIIREGRMFRVEQDIDDPDPSRRYKAAIRKGGMFESAYSADGLRWRLSGKGMRQGQDASSASWDHVEKKWIFSCKYFKDEKRARGYAESKDFEHWTDTYPILCVDELDGPADELYHMSIVRYESVYLGLLKIYHTDTRICDVQLAFSRNAKHWQRIDRIPFIPNSPIESAWDYANIDDTGAPVLMGDELWFYYAGRSTLHNTKFTREPNDGAMGLGKLRLDGFVSMDADDAGGVVTTNPIKLTGDTLYINADASNGEIFVEILEAAKRNSFLDEPDAPLAPFLKTSCVAITADGVRQAVRWSDEPSLKKLQQRPVRLRFHMKNARLFSFWTE